VDGKCVDAGAGAGGSGTGGTITQTDKDAIEQSEPPAKDGSGGMSASTWLLIIGAGAAAYFLLKTDDTKVVKLRESAGKKAAEYKRRMQNGSGVNGLRRSSRARR
jgi:hypothetical protein